MVWAIAQQAARETDSEEIKLSCLISLFRQSEIQSVLGALERESKQNSYCHSAISGAISALGKTWMNIWWLFFPQYLQHAHAVSSVSWPFQ